MLFVIDCKEVGGECRMECPGQEDNLWQLGQFVTVRIVWAWGFSRMYWQMYRAETGDSMPRTHLHALDWGEENTKRFAKGWLINSKGKRSEIVANVLLTRLSACLLETRVEKWFIIALFSGSGTLRFCKSLTNPKNLRIASQLCLKGPWPEPICRI